MRSYKHILGVSSLLFAILLSYLYFDRPLAQWCKQYCVGSCHTFFATITTVGMSSPYLIGSALLYFYFLYFKKSLPFSHHALLLFSSVAFAGIVTDTLKVFLGRFRPCMLFEQGLYGFDFFHIQLATTSFPSGHTTTVFAVAMVVSLYWSRWAVIAWSVAVVVGLSRIMLSAHYLSDVIAGAVVGIMSVKILVYYWPKRWRLDTT
ncbi:MAG: phosphatase PAP2 family protein [Sulfurimonas sp.]|jgi:membrane-associated phospholipid phosphatase